MYIPLPSFQLLISWKFISGGTNSHIILSASKWAEFYLSHISLLNTTSEALILILTILTNLYVSPPFYFSQNKLQIKMNKTGHSRHLSRSLLAIFKKKKRKKEKDHLFYSLFSIFNSAASQRPFKIISGSSLLKGHY